MIVPVPPQAIGHAITLAPEIVSDNALLKTPGQPLKKAALPPHGRGPDCHTPGVWQVKLSALALRLLP